MEWGLLGGERLGGTRRVRTLGLGATVRAFNELAVPGMGGVWFAQQLLLALLGIRLAAAVRADGHRPSNIAAANAVEALAVWSALRGNGWNANPRLPGSRKLHRHAGGADPTFKIAAGRAFYVVNPMRIRTRDALATLGLVEAASSRFNSYAVSALGATLLDIVCPNACKALPQWLAGGPLPTARRRSDLDEELDPTRQLPEPAREILREAFVSGAGPEPARRRQALAFVEALRWRSGGHTDWERRPAEIGDASHWADMRAGAALTDVMEAAAGEIEGGSVLGRIEASMGALGTRRLALAEAPAASLRPSLESLRRRARAFLDADHDPSPGRAAATFCRECIDDDDQTVIRHLVARDERILRLVDGTILPGPAFKGQPFRTTDADLDQGEEEATEEAPEDAIPPLPEAISVRIGNLAALSPDLHLPSMHGRPDR